MTQDLREFPLRGEVDESEEELVVVEVGKDVAWLDDGEPTEKSRRRDLPVGEISFRCCC